MRRLGILVVLALVPVATWGREAKQLRIYFLDVEGGQATLIVSPSGHSMLVDTGWPGANGRDAERIAAAAKDAGVNRIDYLIITHYHRDHVGGVAQLVQRMKIGTFVDHGPNLEDSDDTRKNYAEYEKLAAAGKHVVVKPGDEIPIKGMDVLVLTGAGDHVGKALPGAGQANTFCVDTPDASPDASENARSLGFLLTYGKFRFLDLGDLSKRKELELACPNNLIGTVGLYLTTHHGLDQSNAKPLVWAIHPKVAIMNNGARKGGSPSAWQIVHDSPGLEDLWQLHYAEAGGPDHNAAQDLIANPDEKGDKGYWIKVIADKDGAFTVENQRNGEKKRYASQ